MSGQIVSTLFFDTEGDEHTEATLERAFSRAHELEIHYVLVASTRGSTASMALDAAATHHFGGQVIIVGEHSGYHTPGHQEMSAETIARLEARGARVFFGTHALSSAERSFRFRYGGIGTLEIVADTLRRFARGAKTGVEMALMLADAGWIPVDEDVITVGGSGGGADTCLVLRAAASNAFFDLKIREVLAMPRTRMIESATDAITLYVKGVPADQITRETRLSKATVERYIREYTAVRNGLAAGSSQAELSAQLQRGRNTIQMYIDLVKRLQPIGTKP